MLQTICMISVAFAGAADAAVPLRKEASALYPEPVVAQVRANVATDAWAASVRDHLVEAAAPWRAMSDDDLWDLMFCATLPRSWMVWSDGYSPATGDPVPMYNWIMDALAHPWKVKCPHSGELFPKNDFQAYFESGLDEARIFDPARADTTLLFNTDHPDPDDPLHLYGVDDGFGYVNEKGERWRFINAYLIYGQWKQAVLSGIRNLSAAYLLTGEPEYARKAGILLDRVADLYPTFDFGVQGVMYEGPPSAGYVSTWHDACEETREMAQGYDMIFEAIRDDEALVAFLSRKAAEAGLENPKASFADIQRNIEGRVLRDALINDDRVRSNYPRTDVLKATILAVLNEPAEDFWGIVEPMLHRATAVDGVTGEKGLSGYASYTIAGLALFLAEFAKADPGFLPEALARCPRIHDAYRFHIDTYCLGRYYPQSGDSGQFAAPVDRYVGMNMLRPGTGSRYKSGWSALPPSSFRLLWDLYTATGDPAFVQTLYAENGGTLDGLPHDIFGDNPAGFRAQVAAALSEHGEEVALGSVNKEEWHLAILRSGEGTHARALWLDYDTGGAHGHRDGLNLGLFAFGIDLLPEMGYPPVQYGGWGAPRARWYTMSAAHNTVVVGGQEHTVGAGTTELWVDDAFVRAIRARGPAMNDGRRFERTAVLVDLNETEFYVVDVLRVAGGTNHTQFVHSHFGEVALRGVALAPEETGLYGGEMRAFQFGPTMDAGWSAVWSFEDRLGVFPDEQPRGMRYTCLTHEAAPGIAEGWISVGSFDSSEEAWIPRLLVRREADGNAELVSTFVSVYEPFAGAVPTRTVRRLVLEDSEGNRVGDEHVALEVRLADGSRDIVILLDPEADPPLASGNQLRVRGEEIWTTAQLGVLRASRTGTSFRKGFMSRGGRVGRFDPAGE